jgi:hypothetical protein
MPVFTLGDLKGKKPTPKGKKPQGVKMMSGQQNVMTISELFKHVPRMLSKSNRKR